MPLVQPVVAVFAFERLAVVAELPVGEVVPDFFPALVMYAHRDETFPAQWFDHFRGKATRFVK